MKIQPDSNWLSADAQAHIEPTSILLTKEHEE